MAEPKVAVAPLAYTAAARFAQELRRRLGDAVVEVRLFGSFARGEADEDSDVDVAVVLERVDWTTQRDVIDLATDVGLPLDLRLSPAIFDRETYALWRAQERPLLVDIEREGIPL
ncbi:MAG TPA: nucleotidyltransferase domain-containing protein [Thermoanaerobaculia bacterium]|nr:nucleotidyltransferase domain-containing protein [Thermoanaerobaculia bacterium]